MGARSRLLTGDGAIVVAPAVATFLVYLPQLVTDAGQVGQAPVALRWAWLLLLLLAAPVAAAAVAGRTRTARGRRAAVVAGVAQWVLCVVLVRLDVWLEVRSGYLLAGSGEEAMAYGLSTIAGMVGGLALGTLVGLSVLAGAGPRRPGRVSLP